MILTTCAACAAPLAHDAPRCVRCKLRYCDSTYELTLSLREDLCRATLDGDSSVKEKRKALRTLADVAGIMRRVMGPAHPDTRHAQRQLEIYRTQFPGPTA